MNQASTPGQEIKKYMEKATARKGQTQPFTSGVHLKLQQDLAKNKFECLEVMDVNDHNP